MEIPRHWRLKGPRYRLEGVACVNGHPVFPPRPICIECSGITPIHPDYKKGDIYVADSETAKTTSFAMEPSSSSK